MNAAKAWPVGIVAALAITVASNVAMLMAASGRDAPVPERDYYRRGVAWDSTVAAARRSVALGWSVEARLVPAASGAAGLALASRDRDGRPLAGAAVEVVARHFAAPARTVTGRGRLDAAGRLTLAGGLDRAGRWEIALARARGEDRFSATFDREHAGPAR